MFRSIRRVLARAVSAGRIKHSFAIAVAISLFALPVTEALAYFSATGTGTISNVQAGTSASTVPLGCSPETGMNPYKLARISARCECIDAVNHFHSQRQNPTRASTRPTTMYLARREMFIEFRVLMSEPRYIGIPVWAVHGGPLQRTPVDNFQPTILAAAHEMEAEMAAVKIRDAYRALNAKGIPTGMAAYGYSYVGKTRTSGAMQPDPEQAPVVRRIFEMYADGSNPLQIAQTLVDEGIPSRSKRGWLPDTISAMLSNLTYTARTYNGSRRDKTGDIIQAPWPAIIDDGLFARVQDRLKRLTPLQSRYKRIETAGGPKRKQNPKTAHPFVFRGLLWCHECNGSSWASTATATSGTFAAAARRPSRASMPPPSVRSSSCRGSMT
jgi:hypothetical protein